MYIWRTGLYKRVVCSSCAVLEGLYKTAMLWSTTPVCRCCRVPVRCQAWSPPPASSSHTRRSAPGRSSNVRPLPADTIEHLDTDLAGSSHGACCSADNTRVPGAGRRAAHKGMRARQRGRPARDRRGRPHPALPRAGGTLPATTRAPRPRSRSALCGASRAQPASTARDI